MEQLFRRMAFNVLAGECDDHTKNFSFRLRRPIAGEGVEETFPAWELASAYDLTGSRFPSEDPWSAHGGVHQLSVNGKRRNITDEDLLSVAGRFGIGTANRVLKEIRDVFLWQDA